MKVNIFIDDSGQLHKNYPKSHIFVYGGFWVTTDYCSNVDKYYGILKRQIFHTNKEIKASSMSCNIKKQIINRICNKFKGHFHPIFLCVDVDQLTIDFDDKKAIQLHKNYLIRRLIEHSILDQRHFQILNIDTEIFIDNQSQTTLSNFDSLERYLNKHLHNKYYSESYITSNALFKSTYLDSKTSNLIQIADILANSKFQYYSGNFNKFKMFLINKNFNSPLKLP